MQPPPGGTAIRAATATPDRGDITRRGGSGMICAGDNCTIHTDPHINDVPVAPAPAPTPQTPPTTSSNAAAAVDKLTLGMSLGLGVPTFLVVGAGALCVSMISPFLSGCTFS